LKFEALFALEICLSPAMTIFALRNPVSGLRELVEMTILPKKTGFLCGWVSYLNPTYDSESIRAFLAVSISDDNFCAQKPGFWLDGIGGNDYFA
jgi:hypothetical protein